MKAQPASGFGRPRPARRTVVLREPFGGRVYRLLVPPALLFHPVRVRLCRARLHKDVRARESYRGVTDGYCDECRVRGRERAS